MPVTLVEHKRKKFTFTPDSPPPVEQEERVDGDKGNEYHRYVIFIGVENNPNFLKAKKDLGLEAILRQNQFLISKDEYSREFFGGEWLRYNFSVLTTRMKIQHTAEGAMQLDHFDYLHLDKDNNFYCRSFSYGIITNIHHKWYSLLLTDQKGKEEGNRDENNLCQSSYYKLHNKLQDIQPSDKPLVFCQSYSGTSPIIIDTVKDCLIPPGELLSPEFSFSPIESAQNAMRSFHIIKDHPESEAYEGLKSSHDAAVARFRMFLAKKFSEYPGEYRNFKPVLQSHLPASLKHYSIMGNNGK